MGQEAPVTPGGWEENKKSMVRVGGVLDDAWRCRPQAAYMVNVLSGGQLGAGGQNHGAKVCAFLRLRRN